MFLFAPVDSLQGAVGRLLARVLKGTTHRPPHHRWFRLSTPQWKRKCRNRVRRRLGDASRRLNRRRA